MDDHFSQRRSIPRLRKRSTTHPNWDMGARKPGHRPPNLVGEYGVYGKAPHNGLGSSFVFLFFSSVLVTRVCGLQVSCKPGHPIQIILAPWLTLFLWFGRNPRGACNPFWAYKRRPHIDCQFCFWNLCCFRICDLSLFKSVVGVGPTLQFIP